MSKSKGSNDALYVVKRVGGIGWWVEDDDGTAEAFTFTRWGAFMLARRLLRNRGWQPMRERVTLDGKS